MPGVLRTMAGVEGTMDFGIRGRVAMVAASSKGLGFASALELAKEGCAVSLCGRSRERLDAAVGRLQAQVPEARVHTTVCDVSAPNQLGVWHRETAEALGPVDILVTNTGGPTPGRFMTLSEDQWAAGVESTLLNVVRLCRLVIPAMQARGWGRIIHITSLVAKQPAPILTLSSTLRAGLSGLTKTLASELAPSGITVHAVLPGHIHTERQLELAHAKGLSAEAHLDAVSRTIPAGRLGTPEELAAAVAFLASHRAGYLTGTSLQVDGGLIQSTF